MVNFAILLLCLALGILLKAAKLMPEDGHRALNGFIVNVSLPAMTLAYVHELEFTRALLPLIAMPWVVFACALVFFGIVGRQLQLDRATVGALALTAGLGNTSFVGIPMLQALIGTQAVAMGLLVDQLGSYLVLSTLGVIVASFIAAEKAGWRVMAKRILTFPPLLSLLLALVLMRAPYPEWLMETLKRLAGTLAPLALVSVGMQLSFKGVQQQAAALNAGLMFKLLLAPLVIAVLYKLTNTAGSLAGHVGLLEAAMAPSIGAGIVAAQYRLNPPLVAMLMGVGIPLSFLTVPAWHVIGSL